MYARESTWRLEQQKEACLRREIDACKIVAAFDGFVIAPPPPRGAPPQPGPTPVIVEGDQAMPGQNLLALGKDPEVRASGISAEQARRIRPGQVVEVVGFEGKITGVVESIEKQDLGDSLFRGPLFVARIKLNLDASITTLPPEMRQRPLTLRIAADPEPVRPAGEAGPP
jgi:hypothetical protein